jgi:hypothetical protein
MAAIAWGSLLAAEQAGGKVEYAGGTIGELAHGPKGRLITVNENFLVFEWKTSHYLVRWERINLLEYGQRVGRRYAMAVLISPVLVLSKTRKHFLTIGFTDEEGRQQAMVFRVDKDDIRALLVSLEAKANLKVEYQDEDARRGGKG